MFVPLLVVLVGPLVSFGVLPFGVLSIHASALWIRGFGWWWFLWVLSFFLNRALRGQSPNSGALFPSYNLGSLFGIVSVTPFPRTSPNEKR